ncbi:MAG: class I SAM-dependent methyltransferase [Syntrophomonadaceae bacterium]
MANPSMTALVSAFSRAYHSMYKEEKIFDDYLAREVLSPNEYDLIAHSMSKGIQFFNPGFTGNPREALRWIVDNQLSPAVLGRAAFAEKALELEVRIGTRQYIILGAGYDTFAYRQPAWASQLQIFELDAPVTSEDKQRRMSLFDRERPANLHYIAVDFTEPGWVQALTACPAFHPNKRSFCSLLGLSYYLATPDFQSMICNMAALVPEGSSLVFDYPDQDTLTEKAGERTRKQVAMAAQAGEKMQAGYSYEEIEKLLEKCDFLIYEHLTADEINGQCFNRYNRANPEHPITVENVCFCLAVKQ